ncbi:MAG: 4-hydroxy-tetrahydrodipicolinate reductase, partial [Lachnospiraceae bacterium]|nr:4-hydroxy-tetrahydrodipicolinate reductase [Lachnospiraceae bacterium]
MRIIINGAGGRMGQAVLRKIQERPGLEAAALVSMEFETDAAAGRYQSIGECDVPADVVIDFSHHTAAPVLASWCASRNIPAVIATTGL